MKLLVFHNDEGEPMSAALQSNKRELERYLQDILANDLDDDEVLQVRLDTGSETQLVKALRGTLERGWDNGQA